MKYKHIYVFCPYGLVTGGPDALHQMVYYLSELDCNVHLVYVDIKSKKCKIPQAYQCYTKEYLLRREILDDKENAIIVPETLTHYLSSFEKCSKFIWWLSVDNDVKTSGFLNKSKKIFRKLFDFRNVKKLYKLNTLSDVIRHKKYSFQNEDGITHLCASHYAFDYVSKHADGKTNIVLCIEPISLFFLKNVRNEKARENIILYNPKKNYEFTKEIIKQAKDLKFTPLRGYSQNELVALYSKAKVYIDFGWFPGAERIPKEAVINGCCIITGKNGASAHYGDVPIGGDYKIDSLSTNIPHIITRIEDCLLNYNELISDFEEYRNMVLGLEEKFIATLKNLFGEIL